MINLLTRLEDSELKTVVRFAKSPFHNSNKLIINMLQELLVFHPKFNSKKLTKEYLFHKIHSQGIVYHDGRMNVLMTQLAKLIERFYMYQEFEEDESLKKKMQSRGFRKRGFYHKFRKTADGNILFLDNESIFDLNYFYQKFQINEEIFFQRETDKLGDGQQYLKEAMKYLDQFFIIAKTKLSMEFLTRASTHEEKLEIKFFEQILKYTNAQNIDSPFLLSIYQKMFQLKVREFKEQDYDNLKNMFIEKIDNMNLDDQHAIFLNLINLNINRFNHGKQKALEEIFRLYQVGSLKNLILKNGQITENTFFNIASVGAANGEYEWSDEFINKNEKYLPKSNAFQVKSYALATLYFVMGNKKDRSFFHDTMEVLSEAVGSRKNNLIIINSKSLLIRSYYELMKEDISYNKVLENLFVNFENQLKNNKTVSKRRIKGFLAFNDYAKQLHKYRKTPEKFYPQLLELKTAINIDNDLVLKHWIKQKLEELLSSSSKIS